MTELPAQPIFLVIDEKPVSVPAGTNLLQAARQVGIKIPSLCVHEATKPNGLCRLCVVEIEGARLLAPACIVQAGQDMVVHTCSERVLRARRTILELLASAVDLSDAPEIQNLLQESGADQERFAGGEDRQQPVLDDNPMYIRDYAKCVLCWRCVRVCAEDAQYTFALSFKGRGFHSSIATFFDRGMLNTTCVFCGQCIGVCPTGALKSRREWLLENGLSPTEINAQAPNRKRPKRAQLDGKEEE
jgi:NADH dehydrogenase/NADH:ubiquinone oxidoreductase subunit G